MEQRIALDGTASWRGVDRRIGGHQCFGQGYVGSSREPSRFLLYRIHQSIPSVQTWAVDGLSRYCCATQPIL